jgi:phosphoribosylanthranilate isomerase
MKQTIEIMICDNCGVEIKESIQCKTNDVQKEFELCWGCFDKKVVNEYSDSLKKEIAKIAMELCLWDSVEDWDRYDWRRVSVQVRLSEEFIDKFSNKVRWDYISKHQTLSEAFIEKYHNKVNWTWISGYQKLSEAFIDKYHNKVNWYWISRYQTLSEALIEKYHDKAIWKSIWECQKLSRDFKKRFVYKLI